VTQDPAVEARGPALRIVLDAEIERRLGQMHLRDRGGALGTVGGLPAVPQPGRR
jgi:hypothetical protein